ncbi:unnamed protein product [Effrenium voratum]|uniref:Pentatricopeptide repeat-containing protein n=1 Tax=Effrenium voratum TaxID=2562239 RepID=A0AA36JSF8_9DINO|nr:unnamed protein product [Effrenium voratum]
MGYNTLLRGYGRRGDFLKAEYWMRRMRARGVAPDMFSYGALVQSYVEAKDLPGAERALQSMLENVKIKRSNTFAYNTLLKHYASEAQVEKAESLLEKMQEDGVTPDGTTYLQMIRVAGATGDTEGAAEWLKRLEQQGEAIWEAHFHAVMSGHAKLGDMEGAEAWFRAMLDAGFRPDLVSFNILMSAAASGGDTGGAEGVLLRMADVEVAPEMWSPSERCSAPLQRWAMPPAPPSGCWKQKSWASSLTSTATSR